MPDEVGIYLSYVRKLGFEEAPDYDFLRDLFAKIMKNNGDVDDGVYDWNLLNGGKGWEASAGQSVLAQQPPPRNTAPRNDGRRNSQNQQANIIPPSPALVRHGSKRGMGIPSALIPGTPSGVHTPHSAAANVGVPVSNPRAGHPYADHSTNDESYGGNQQQPYERASPMVSTVSGVGAAQPALSQVRARGGAGDVTGDDEDHAPQHKGPGTLIKILTCRCG